MTMRIVTITITIKMMLWQGHHGNPSSVGGHSTYQGEPTVFESGNRSSSSSSSSWSSSSSSPWSSSSFSWSSSSGTCRHRCAYHTHTSSWFWGPLQHWGTTVSLIIILEKITSYPNISNHTNIKKSQYHNFTISQTKVRAGCVELLNSVQKRIKPKYHVYGHIHEGGLNLSQNS